MSALTRGQCSSCRFYFNVHSKLVTNGKLLFKVRSGHLRLFEPEGGVGEIETTDFLSELLKKCPIEKTVAIFFQF